MVTNSETAMVTRCSFRLSWLVCLKFLPFFFFFLNFLLPPLLSSPLPSSVFSGLSPSLSSSSLLLLLSQLVSERCCSLEVDSFDVCLFVCVCPSSLFLLRSKPISSRRQKRKKYQKTTKKQASISLSLCLNDGWWRQLQASVVFFTHSASEGKKRDVLLFIFFF